MEDKIRLWYESLIDIYGRAKAATVLADKIYLDFGNNSKIRDVEIIIITSLYHTAAISLYAIFDNDSCSLSIYQFRSAYYGEKSRKPKFKIDQKALWRLQERRNKLLAHLDQCTIFDDSMEELHLYIEDLKSLLKSIENELFPLAKRITGSAFGRDCSTGEWFFQPIRNIEVQYEEIKNAILTYKKMYSYMKEYCMQELFTIVYCKNNINDEQSLHCASLPDTNQH